MGDAAAHKRRPWQFRLRTLLLAMAVTAIVLPGIVTNDEAVRASTMMAVRLVIIVFLAMGAMRTRGYAQAFCVGSLIPQFIPTVYPMIGSAGVILVGFLVTIGEFFHVAGASSLPSRDELLWLHLIDLVGSAMSGVLAMLIHSVFDRGKVT